MYISYQNFEMSKNVSYDYSFGGLVCFSPQGATIMICNCEKFEYDTLSKACYKVLKAIFL